ncbi:MCE family protein [Leptobacterium flavescens]|uniref:MCE family protein n=1 Tax=Leptobacterium flavescens TaxID=472055 RepID=A0A6P0ULA0_9FLAO|nr:MlaD family protein [Leptobacterium flavescens]NER14004.1 MCE family protein [Leptobacterium flavescens]
MKLSRELKTAIIVLGGILLGILLFSYLKSNSVFTRYRTFYVVYDHVGGLATATPVMVNGFPIGKTKDIRFLDKSGKLLVTLAIDGDFEFSKHSVAELFDTGIIGGKSIQIIPVFDGSAPAMSGDTLSGNIKPGITELVTQKLTPLQEQLGQMLVSGDSLLVNVNGLLDNQAKSDIKSSLAGLNETIANFKKASESINELIKNNDEKLNTTLGNVENITTNLSKVSDSLAEANIGTAVKDLQSTVSNINSVLKKIDNGEGSIGKLLKDEELYDNLSGASKQLEELLEDMKLNPKRYVHFSLFGKRPKQYEPSKEETENN